MFKGRRDDHITIRVPQELCYKYASKTGQKFIEIRLPGGDDDAWYSFMVEPSQVFFDHAAPDKYNIIEGINRDTEIVVSQKKASNNSVGRSAVSDSAETYDPLMILHCFESINADNPDHDAAVKFHEDFENEIEENAYDAAWELGIKL